MMGSKLIELYEDIVFRCTPSEDIYLAEAGTSIARALMKLTYYPWASKHLKNQWMHNVVDAIHRVHKRGVLFKRYPREWWIHYNLYRSISIIELHSEFQRYFRPDGYHSLDMRSFDAKNATIIINLYLHWAAKQLSTTGRIKYTEAFDKIESLLNTHRYINY